MRLLRDVLLQDLALGGLGVAKVHHFVHEFIDDDKVVSDTLFFELFEVFDEDLGEAMEEDDDLCCVRVALRQCEDWESLGSSHLETDRGGRA